MTRPLILIALLAGCSPAVNAKGELPGGFGGNIDHFYESMLEHTGPVRLTDDRYYSADTIWIAHDQACTLPYVVFEFHSPHNMFTGGKRHNHRELVGNWAAIYDGAQEALGRWFYETYIKYSFTKVVDPELKTGAELIAAGVLPECEPLLNVEITE